MATAIPYGWQVEDANGVPVSGAKIYFYVPDTVTARTPYTNKALTVPSANPVVADAAGWFNVYLSSELAYDIVIKSADDAITYQSRNVPSNISGAQPVDATLTALAAAGWESRKIPRGTGTDTVANIYSGDLFDFTNVKDYGATGDGSTNDTAAITAAITAAGTGGAVFFPEGVYIFNSVLTQLSGQRWFGAGRAVSILRLAASVTSINVCVTASDFATDYSIEDLQIDGNRDNITPASNLFSTFYLVRGPRGGKRGVYRNLLLSNSWGRSLQTSDETQTEYAEDILVDGVWATNAGTKAISATRSKRVTIQGCFAEVDPYTAAENTGGGADATSGSCFEVNESHDVTVSGCHGVQIGASLAAPGIRCVNASSNVRAFGNTIEDASYGAFVQNCNDVKVYGNTFRDIRGNAVLIADADASQPTDTCLRVRVYENTIIDPDDAYILITANKDGYDAYVEAYIYDNDFVQSAGSPTYGIYNDGVISPATGGTCTVYAWNNRFTGTIPNKRGGAAAAEIQPRPDEGWQIIAKASGTSGTPIASVTGTTSETTLATITIPGTQTGKNGILSIEAHFSFASGGAPGNRITRVRHAGGQLIATTNANTVVQQRFEIQSRNRGAQAAQIVSIPGAVTGFGAVTTAVLETTVNTAIDRDITLTCQLADTGDTGKLEGYTVKLLYGL